MRVTEEIAALKGELQKERLRLETLRWLAEKHETVRITYSSRDANVAITCVSWNSAPGARDIKAFGGTLEEALDEARTIRALLERFK